MSQRFFRLYGQIGCGHCAQAEQFLRSNRIDAELFVVGNDPIIQAGIKAIVPAKNEKEELVVVVPVLVSFLPGAEKVIPGFRREDYEGLLADYSAFISANSPNLFAGGSQIAGQAASVASEQIAASEGAV